MALGVGGTRDRGGVASAAAGVGRGDATPRVGTATTALALALLGPGASVAVAAGAYFGTARGLRTFERWGVGVVEFDQKGQPPDGADVVWLEVPSNPLLEVPEFQAAAAHPGVVVVD